MTKGKQCSTAAQWWKKTANKYTVQINSHISSVFCAKKMNRRRNFMDLTQQILLFCWQEYLNVADWAVVLPEYNQEIEVRHRDWSRLFYFSFGLFLCQNMNISPQIDRKSKSESRTQTFWARQNCETEGFIFWGSMAILLQMFSEDRVAHSNICNFRGNI